MSKKQLNFSGYKIKGLRLAKQLSPIDVAKELDITTTYLSLIENGKKKPSMKVIRKAAKLFNVEEDSFIDNNELIDELKTLTEKKDLADIIHAFESIMHGKLK